MIRRLTVPRYLIECRHKDVRAHDRLHSGRDCRLERGESALVRIFGHYWQGEVGVNRRVAVAWKVLGAGSDARALQPLHPRRRVSGDQGWLGATMPLCRLPG